MSFKFNLKKRVEGFSVRLRSYAFEDRQAAGKEHLDYIEKTLPQNEWARYGFDEKMTYEEALAHVRTLNSSAKDKELKERKARFRYVEEQERTELLTSAYLPEAIVDAFEKKLENDSYSANFKKSKTYFHWKTVMKVIADIGLAPDEWADNKRGVIKKLEGYAPSTVSKIINLMNSYGTFYSRKVGKFYEPLKPPRGNEVGRISDKYLNKTDGRTKEAKGVGLADMNLIAHASNLTDDEKRWCVVALGLALRPSEVDSISKGVKDFIEVGKGHVKVFQPKLVSLPRNMRYKEVKISHQFQKEAVKIVSQEMNLKKPSIKKLRTVLGDEYGLYSFRKGYTDIMLNLKEDITRISSDLGHSSIDRTWRDYKKKIMKGKG